MYVPKQGEAQLLPRAPTVSVVNSKLLNGESRSGIRRIQYLALGLAIKVSRSGPSLGDNKRPYVKRTGFEKSDLTQNINIFVPGNGTKWVSVFCVGTSNQRRHKAKGYCVPRVVDPR
jgi:hypothetical protein